MTDSSGYGHRAYVESLAELGVPRPLTRSRAWILKRPISGSSLSDGMGCYPLFCCSNWSGLHADLEDLKDEVVCLSLVTDPFGDFDPHCLRRCFEDVMVPYKEHFIVDLSYPMDSYVSPHHRRNARKAFQNLGVERCARPEQHLDEWSDLYAALVQRHKIKGILQFSKSTFDRQLRVPGIVVFRAVKGQRTLGMLLWYRQGNVGYYHLGAYCDLGYELGASFALFWFALEHFAAEGLQWLCLGGGAGFQAGGTDGLSRFKRGWANGKRVAYFCGRVFNRTHYQKMAQSMNAGDDRYFPIYRRGEFS